MAKQSGKKKTEGGELVVANNRKARHEFEIFDTYEAGLVLQGSEVKSIREGGVNLRDSYVRTKGDELYLVGCHISPYSHSPGDAHPLVRDRKLLLHRREIGKIIGNITQKGLTIVALRMYFKKGRCKLEIGLAKGRKLHDKREEMKRREADRSMERAIKGPRPGPRKWSGK